MKTIVWEPVEHDHAGYLYRARVFGGWIIKLTEEVLSETDSGGISSYDQVSSIAFVPDAQHEWDEEGILPMK